MIFLSFITHHRYIHIIIDFSFYDAYLLLYKGMNCELWIVDCGLCVCNAAIG
uniref:Uncharacterized protein MANES_01G016000 n=1 Tax=Rhizophora mucronata TaxID=61149 RepID=A0A2P2IWM7_RHIMU